MFFNFQKIKSPNGVEDSAVIIFKEKQHFISSMGTQIDIFDSTNKIASFETKYKIYKILPYSKYYFLIGKEGYFVYKDCEMVTECKFSVVFEKILKILLFKNSFVFIHDKRKFTLGNIINFRLVFDSDLNDNHYFHVLSAEALNDKAFLLVSTFSKRFIITYETEGISCFKQNRREIQNGNYLVKRKEDFLLFDEQGMWQYGLKITFIKEFANYKISTSYSNEYKTILFCMDGEVIVIENDNSHYTAGYLSCPIENVTMINDVFFCTSRSFSYFIKISNKIECIHGFGTLKGNSNLLTMKMNETLSLLEFSTDKTFSSVEYLMKPIFEKGIDSSIEHFISLFNNFLKVSSAVNYNFNGCYICNEDLIINFDKFSIFQGVVINPVLAAFRYKNTNFISLENTLLIAYENQFKTLKIQSKLTKFFNNLGIFLYEEKLTILDLNTLKFVVIKIDCDIYDFEIENNEIVCIDLNEKIFVYKIENINSTDLTPNCELKDIKISINTEIDSLAADCKILFDGLLKKLNMELENSKNSNKSINMDPPVQKAESKHLSNDTNSLNSIFLTANGKIFTVKNKKLKLLLNLKQFIYKITKFEKFLIISAERTFVYNLNTKELLKASLDSTNAFVHLDKLFLTSNTGINNFSSFGPEFEFNETNCKTNNNQKLILNVANSPVSGEPCINSENYKINFKNNELIFENKSLICSSKIRKNMICIGFADITKREGTLTLISFKSNGKIKIENEIFLDDYPLSVCSFGNKICVITPSKAILYKNLYGKLMLRSSIEHKGLVKSSQFISKNEIIIRCQDWAFSKINFKTKECKTKTTEGTAIPFSINGNEGYGVGSMINILGSKIECQEKIANIFTVGRQILIFGVNGSVFLLEKAEDISSQSLYDTVPTIILK